MHQKLSASKFWRMSAESLERLYVSGFLSPAAEGEGGGRREGEREKADNANLLITLHRYGNLFYTSSGVIRIFTPRGHHSHYYMQYITELSLFE